EAPLHDLAALVEVDAERIELAFVPADRSAHDQAPLGDMIDGGELLGEEDGIAHGHDQDTGANLDFLGARGHGGEDGQRLVNWKARVDAEQDVVPGPQRFVAQFLCADAVFDQLLRAWHLRMPREIAHCDAEYGRLLRAGHGLPPTCARVPRPPRHCAWPKARKNATPCKVAGDRARAAP